MNIYNNLEKEDKYLLLVRKLKEGFISFTDDLLEVFPNVKSLFMQRIIAYQLPDTCLYKILSKNFNYELLQIQDEYYLKYKLCFLKDYEQYLNYDCIEYKCFTFNDILDNKQQYIMDDNIEMIWKWIKILNVIINTINKL